MTSRSLLLIRLCVSSPLFSSWQIAISSSIWVGVSRLSSARRKAGKAARSWVLMSTSLVFQKTQSTARIWFRRYDHLRTLNLSLRLQSKEETQHDLLGEVASEFFPNVRYYSTYTADNLIPVGQQAITPTLEQIDLKNKALDCYETQIRVIGIHFDAVRGKPEYLNDTPHSW